MSNNMEKDNAQAMHTAITELVLNLKGDGTVSSVQKKIGVHRNMLTAIFEVYDAQMRGEEVKTKSDKAPRIKTLYWGTNSLITVADTLGIPLSELIRAAEDVRDGLPPWFERRISRDVESGSTDELAHIFLEALGCFSYADPFPSPEPKTKERKYHYHKKDTPGNTISTQWREMFTEKEISELKYIVPPMFENSKLNEFVAAYQTGTITSEDAYRILREVVVNFVKEEYLYEETIVPRHLFDRRLEVIRAIEARYKRFRELENQTI